MAKQRATARTFGLPRGPLGLTAGCLLGLGLFFTLNWSYQVARKPSELVGLAGLARSKTQRSTWESYGHLFHAHSTDIVSPTLLAALAQVESQGNPHARTYWRWRWSWHPFEIYAPASSAVGLFQITDGTFEEARRLCIHDHQVVRDGPWHDAHSCWFNGLYSRLVPSHAVEMTAAHLHLRVTELFQTHRLPRAAIEHKQNLAAVIHLCGLQRGLVFAQRSYRVAPGETCGRHDVRAYLARVNGLQRAFARLQPPD